MTTIEIKVHISASTALALGLARAGNGTVPATEEGLAALTIAERAALERYVGGTACLYLAGPATWDSVVAALRAALASELAEAERVKSERAAHRADLLSRDPAGDLGSALYHVTGVWRLGDVPAAFTAADAADTDLAHWLCRARDVDSAARTRAAESEKQQRADAEAERARAAAAQLQRVEALLDWSSARDEAVRLGRAAGYDQSGLARRLLAEHLVTELSAMSSEDAEVVDRDPDLEVRGGVTEESLEEHAALVERAAALAAPVDGLPAGLTLEVGRISRQTVDVHSDECAETPGRCLAHEECSIRKRTVVPVRVVGGDRDLWIVVPLE